MQKTLKDIYAPNFFFFASLKLQMKYFESFLQENIHNYGDS